MKKTRTGYEILKATVQEMGEDPAAGIDIPVDEAKLKAITEQDEHPRFVTLQVAREGCQQESAQLHACAHRVHRRADQRLAADRRRWPHPGRAALARLPPDRDRMARRGRQGDQR